MSNPYLPPEILDYIVDLLHDNPNALQKCCLVSKSWIHRTRKHLFAEVDLISEERLGSWKGKFLEPSTSAGQFAKSLRVGCAGAITAADAEAGGWLTGFAHIVRLEVETPGMYTGESLITLIPFHIFSRTVKSLRVKSVDIPPSRIFNFILSSPLLEDLTVARYGTSVDNSDDSNGPPIPFQPSNPPVFTGSLKLSLESGMKPIVDRLLSMSGGIHFRKLVLTWYCVDDLLSSMGLVEECSHTLESLDITCVFGAESGQGSVDLSKATKLKDVAFRIDSSDVEWATMALRTVTPKHRDLRQISISAYYLPIIAMLGYHTIMREIEERTRGQWLELDRLLVQLWESYSTPPKILFVDKIARDLIGRLLPETTEGGTVNLFDDSFHVSMDHITRVVIDLW